MSDDGDGFDLGEALENSAVGTTVKTVLGLRQEAHVCPDCNVACEPSETHDPQRMACDGGTSPSWECPECGSHYVREVSDDSHALDLYGRGRE